MDYKYQNLACRDEIRILVLQPAAGLDDPIHAKIIHRKYPIKYEDASGVNYWHAVSYTWGLELPCEALHIDSTLPKEPNDGRKTILITPNVDRMLRNLRDKQYEHNLWIDAICLNQEDMQEKSQQIPQMGWIYRLAYQVIIWLGEDDGIARAGMKSVEALAFISTRLGHHNSILFHTALIAALKDVSGSPQSHALDRLFQRPWFGRRWILQELALSCEAIVCYGQYQLPWQQFRKGMEVLYDIQCRASLHQGQILGSQSALALETLLKINRVSWDFLDLLWNFHTSACKEKNDIIYALYGLNEFGMEAPACVEFEIRSDADPYRMAEASSALTAEHSELRIVLFDYGTPWHDLFTQVARQCVGGSGFAAITRHLYAFGSLHETNSDWPSWVPDWSHPRRAELVNETRNLITAVEPVKVVGAALYISARRLCEVRRALELPGTQDFRSSLQRLLQITDSTPAYPDTDDVCNDQKVNDLTTSEAIFGELVHKGLDTGVCNPVPTESHGIIKSRIIDVVSASDISVSLFRRVNKDSLLDAIATSLLDTSLFFTDTDGYGIGTPKMTARDQIVLLQDYSGFPKQCISGWFLELAAVLRPRESQQQHPCQLQENAEFILIGPCILARRGHEAVQTNVKIKLF